MLKNPCTRLVPIVAVSLLSLAFGASEELFSNGSFESGLDDWRTLNMSGNCQFEIDRKVKKEGKRSLRVERSSGGRPDFLKQFVDLSSDSGEVSFEALVRIDKVGEVRVSVLFSDADGKPLADHDIATVDSTRKKWKTVAGSYEVPEGAKTFGVNFWFRDEGSVWIDGVSATWKGAAKSKDKPRAGLDNGEFTSGLDGWMPVDLERSGVTGQHDRAVGASRKGSLRLGRDGDRLYPDGGYEARAKRAKREKKATLTFSVRSDQAARGIITLQALDAKGALLGSQSYEYRSASKEFEQSTLSLELTRGTTEVAVTLSMGGRGQVWFDDLVLETR